jgi:hypothetical protein
MRFEFTPTIYGEGLAASIDGAVRVSPFERKKISGKLDFEKTEKGWRSDDGTIY